MRTVHIENYGNWIWILFIFCSLVWGCRQAEYQTQSSTGFNDFGRSVERAYGRLANGSIQKKSGFYNECSVEFSTETGIRVSQSVCDEGESALSVTIRVTDPTSRPPSQRQNVIPVVLAELGKTKLVRGNTQEFPNGTTIKIDRTGQSAILTRSLQVSR